MPLFEKKKGNVDATRHWVGDTRFPLELDLTTHSLSGVRIGSAIEGLMRLGPAEDSEAAQDEIFRYYSRGLEVTSEDGFVTGFRVLFSKQEGFRAYVGRCFLAGEEIKLADSTTESDILEYLGRPFWRDEDESELLLFYEFGPIEWQIEFSRNGMLSQWSILSPPLMANEDQRLAYGVTRIWPPASNERIRPRIAESIMKSVRESS